MNIDIKRQCEMLSYATQILCDDDIPVSADKLKAVLTAAGANVNDVLIRMFESATANVNLKNELWNFTNNASAATTTSGNVTSVPDATADNKDENRDEDNDSESDGSIGFDLFG